MAMMHVTADVADFNTQLKVMDALQRYYRKRHQAKIRMRRYRARLKGWEFDEIAQRAIVPPEELARREEMRKKKEEKAARRGKRGRPRGSRGSRGIFAELFVMFSFILHLPLRVLNYISTLPFCMRFC